MRALCCSSTWGAKVSDFGLSREKSVDETMSVTGTPLWLPPEMIRGERYTEKADVYSFGIGTKNYCLKVFMGGSSVDRLTAVLCSTVLAELDTRKIPYHDIKAKGARNKKVSGSTLMHMVAYENLRPSLSKNCMDSVRELYKRCTSDDQSVRPTFEEIVQFLENDVRKETLVRAVRACSCRGLSIPDPLSHRICTLVAVPAERGDERSRGRAERLGRVSRGARRAPRHTLRRLKIYTQLFVFLFTCSARKFSNQQSFKM
jgi:serine/threonine protein kinase